MVENLDRTDRTTRLYQQAFQYANGLSLDIRAFTDAMFYILDDGIWKTGWIDKVNGSLVSAPTLREFIERPVPKGIGQTIPWTYAALKTSGELGDDKAKQAIDKLNEQIFVEQGVTAAKIYEMTFAVAVNELPPAMTPEEAGAKGGRGNKATTNGPIFNSHGNGSNKASVTIARLKRDYPELAKRVMAGELSPNAAAIEAGFRKKPTPFEIIVKQLPKLTPDERARLRSLL
jgi:hypothetical protein